MARQRRSKKSDKKNDNGARLGFEEKLWLAADKLRSNLDAAEYKEVGPAPVESSCFRPRGRVS